MLSALPSWLKTPSGIPHYTLFSPTLLLRVYPLVEPCLSLTVSHYHSLVFNNKLLVIVYKLLESVNDTHVGKS